MNAISPAPKQHRVTRDGRRLGRYGTAARIAVAVGLLYLAGAADGLPWDVDWYDPIVAFLALPAATLALGLLARHHTTRPIRWTGPLGHAINCVLIVALVWIPYTSAGAVLFYAATMLVAAWRGQPGCEITLISNALLRRDDQVGCPLFFPIDAAEAKHRTRRPGRPAAATD